MWYAAMTLGEPVESQGYAGGARSGDILYKGTVVHDLWQQDMYGQVIYDALILLGDSGGPVYTETWNEGKYEVTAYGINWGRNTEDEWTVFSPVSGIEIELGSLDFTE